ncbi:MAG TPA: NAD(P)H-dependent oxidoreductase subunit E [Longimicrobiales bacterium]|nr:NAD(P)H-dependent oxidoreductase subunit E [Longimicrobiales bacterium]
MAEQTTPVIGNPGFAGETGDFNLTEADVRGLAHVGVRPLEGAHPGGAASYPYQLATKDPDATLFEGPYAERLEKIRSRYPDAQGALLPVLNLAQEIRGHLSQDAMEQVAQTLGLSPTYVRGVATFYTMYNKAPVGDYLIQVCTNVSCNLCGGDDVMEAFLHATSSESGEITPDGLFTVIEAECLGACGFPTAVQVNERYFENVTPGDVPAILDRLRGERPAAATRTPAGPARSEPAREPAGSAATAPDAHVEVPSEPAAATEQVIGPESNPVPGADDTPPAAARPPAANRKKGKR